MIIYKCPACRETVKDNSIFVCVNPCCIFWNKGFWGNYDGVWNNDCKAKNKLINVPDLLPNLKKRPENQWKKMWSYLFCTVGMHNYKTTEISMTSYGVIGELKTCQYCRNRVWKNKMEDIQ